MLTPDEKLKRAAISYSAWYYKARKSKAMEDRKKFVRAENEMGFAALAVYKHYFPEGYPSGDSRRNKNES